MSLNTTPSAERVHIGFFGRRNAGKSSIVNAVTGQDLAVVSDVKGTTTDPVSKAMELLPIGPVMIIDTPGIDDEGTLGGLRVRKTKQVLNKTDIAILVVDATIGKTDVEEEMIQLFQAKEIPYLIVYNKCDLIGKNIPIATEGESYLVSAKQKIGIETLKERIGALAVTEESQSRIVGDLLQPRDFVILVVPIDKAAPKGRLILPQQQTIRDILDADAIAVVTKEFELRDTLDKLGHKPSMVITDSQAFATVSANTPRDIPLTSFSILMARYKGQLRGAIHGAAAIEQLKDGDHILISEGCTHHRQCDDIGTVKLPRWVQKYTGKKITFSTTSGTEFPENLSSYQLVIHCGGCMLNEREMRYRQKCAADQNIPFTNYGIAIAYMQGILERCIEIFPPILKELQEKSHK